MAYIKTNWINGQTPINATNLNHIEDGIEAALEKTSVKTTATQSDSDTYACNYINDIVNEMIHGDVLWENGNLANGWDEYPVPVDLSNYSYVAVDFVYNTQNTNTLKTEKVKVGNNITCTMQWIGGGGTEIMSRNFIVSSSQVDIKKGYTNSSVDRTALIPLKIIGYK